MFGKSKLSWIILIILAAGVKIFSLSPNAVEKYYSTGVYPLIARMQRLLFGWLPFSVGDIFYTLAGAGLLYGLVRLVQRLIRRQAGRAYFKAVLGNTLFVLLLVYVYFNLSWGLNYDRRGIAHQLRLDVQAYSTGELDTLLRQVVTRLGTEDSLAHLERATLVRNSTLFKGAIDCYKTLSSADVRFAYPSSSVKASLYGYLGDYLGFGGYYNPFTGEAQVNTTMPVFVQPYTTCHEIGHQLGYAKENEANFAGYLAARQSGDASFRYSVYFDLYLYAARELYFRDSLLLQPIKAQLSPSVKTDFKELQRFNRRYENPFEPVIRRLYGGYLRANRQPQGMRTYNEVIAWLVAYGKKNGWGAI
ncbi:MAG: DUF3810 domain-containing protein [Chitinophagaceae bacterium]|nr:DUF3810 domain-containing protein [Chitinophagaceae bacterium]